MSERWLQRFERAGWLERAAMLGGGAIRVTAGAIDRVLDRAAVTVLDTKDAFRKELDPNVSDARIIEETTGKDEKRL